MRPFRAFSVGASTVEALFKRLVMAGTVFLAITEPLSGQPKPQDGKANGGIHWLKYVNKEYGFSFLYPDRYRPTDADGTCKENEYRRFLICLDLGDGSDSLIFVTLITSAPFHVHPGSGDVMPLRQRIGHYVFYRGMVGSMGVGFADTCIMNLRGKALEFQFDLPNGPNASEATKLLELRILETLRTF